MKYYNISRYLIFPKFNAPLKFGGGYVISPTYYNGCNPYWERSYSMVVKCGHRGFSLCSGTHFTLRRFFHPDSMEISSSLPSKFWRADRYIESEIDDLVQDCSVSIANALEILQSCTKPSKWSQVIALCRPGALLLTGFSFNPSMDK